MEFCQVRQAEGNEKGPMQNFHRTTLWILFALLAAALGCSGGDVELLPLHSVEGALTCDGKPMPHAIVIFHPAKKGIVEGNPRGVTDEDGRYQLTTFRADDGAPAGEYKVTIYWPQSVPEGGLENADPLPPDRLQEAYADEATTKLTATVPSAGDIDFALP